MDRDRVEGKGKQVMGMKETVCNLTNDDRRHDGLGDEAEGAAQETSGKGKRKIGEAVEDVGKNMKR